jgi:hypothetical protein
MPSSTHNGEHECGKGFFLKEKLILLYRFIQILWLQVISYPCIGVIVLLLLLLFKYIFKITTNHGL